MIITHLMGGLGNQLFQYALGRYLAHKHNTELKLDITNCESNNQTHHSYYQLGAFNIQENFATPAEIKSLTPIYDFNYSEPSNFHPEILNSPDNVWLYGYWQSEKYFSDIAEILRREIILKNPLGKISNSWREKIINADCAVSLHIRHGDYLVPHLRNDFGILPIDYYKICVDELKKKFSSIHVFVFSDDLDWAKKFLNFDLPTEFVEGCEHNYEEMHLMTLCKHNIIANSSFSWWGAWLNPNPDKKVFAPSPWIRNPNWLENIVPDSWIKIQIDYEKSARNNFPPFLSLIVYVENNATTIGLTMQSILAQDFKDYEIVIVDASTDGSGEFCRRFAGNPKITFINANRSTEKFAAWNLGVECARGEYISFLTGKNFIISNAAKYLAQLMARYHVKAESNGQVNYINAIEYNAFFPNIICATQRIAEDAAGTFTINGIPDRKFAVTVDSPFQNLNAATEIKIASAQKLVLLGTNQLNNLLGTKFFKREFLNENKIRFDEKLGADAELMFLVNAFMHTENIVFVPQIFYGRFN